MQVATAAAAKRPLLGLVRATRIPARGSWSCAGRGQGGVAAKPPPAPAGSSLGETALSAVTHIPLARPPHRRALWVTRTLTDSPAVGVTRAGLIDHSTWVHEP